ncbi:hypothetical protein BV25DRAFT_1841614 [Artomyces pyxidatus]|uniref:Uncharacterized protein n=1 Tax=Artomyces pyxidatus TaxID=48021 RepID=A0ACB8SMB0_9AGAM|nr:hypothetical protein BV25DRAFT_1841614 [Artomyces pyxidatus]
MAFTRSIIVESEAFGGRKQVVGVCRCMRDHEAFTSSSAWLSTLLVLTHCLHDKAFVAIGGLGFFNLLRRREFLIGVIYPHCRFTMKQRHLPLLGIRCTILWLPVEVLGLIFHFCRCPDKIQHTDRDCLATLITISHVCRFWRQVSLSSRSLWTAIPLHFTDMVEALLARSEQLPIILTSEERLVVPAADVRRLAIVPLLLFNLSRVKEIRITGPEIPLYFRPLLERAMPLLESLKLDLDISSQDFQYILNEALSLEQIVSPTLRRARLVRCSVDWRSHLPLSPTLTELKIYCEPRERPSLLEIREVMASLPGLMTLVLVDVVKTRRMDIADDLSMTHRVPLTCLRSLHFSTESPVDIRDFISLLSAPADAALHLRINGLDGFRTLNMLRPWQNTRTPQEVTVHNIIHSIDDFFTHTTCSADAVRDTTEYRSVGILSAETAIGSRSDGLCLVVGNHVRSDALPIEEPTWDTKLLLRLPQESLEHARPILPMACRLLHLRDVNTVFVNSPLFSDPKMWWLSFGRIDHITTVVVTGEAVAGFAGAFSGKGRPSDSSAYTELYKAGQDVVGFGHRWEAMKARPLPEFLLDFNSQEISSRLFSKLLHLQIEYSVDVVRPVLDSPGVMEDLTAGLEGLMMERGLSPSGVGPLSTVHIVCNSGTRDMDACQKIFLAERDSRSLLSRFVCPSPNLVADDHRMHWLRRQGGKLSDDAYF